VHSAHSAASATRSVRSEALRRGSVDHDPVQANIDNMMAQAKEEDDE
jgi:hypothetical protein